MSGVPWMAPAGEGCRVLSLHCVERIVCQEPVKLGKGRPLLWLPAPALQHQLIEGLRASGWPGQVHLKDARCVNES